METSGGSKEQFGGLGKTLKEGERVIAPTRRPDGTLRKEIRIRAGYTPPDEVAKYKSKGALLKIGMGALEVPPGYDPILDAKPKTKSTKRNERKKKKQQADLEKGSNSDLVEAEETNNGEVKASEDLGLRSEAVVLSIASQLNKLEVSNSSDAAKTSNPETSNQDLDKKIRALKKKIRLTEAQLQKTERESMNQEQLEKVAKLESWRQEVKLLEDKKTDFTTS